MTRRVAQTENGTVDSSYRQVPPSCNTLSVQIVRTKS